MAIAKITSWLADPNRSYDHGRSLYEQFGTDVVVLAVIKGGNSPYHFTKLFDSLTALNQTLEEKTAPKQAIIPNLSEFKGPAAAPVKNKPDFHSLPDAMKDVTTIKNQHKRRADQLYIEIAFTESSEDRRIMALTMLEDYDKVQECWGILDNYRDTGIVLESKRKTIDEEVKDLSVLQMMNSLKNIRTYLCKDKKKAVAMKPGRQLSKVLARIQENQLKLKLLEERMKNELV